MTRICPNPGCSDIELFGVQGEYGTGVSHCPKCGALLEEKEPPAEGRPDREVDAKRPEWFESEMPRSGEFTYIATFRDLPSAHVARSLLVAFGCYAELLDERHVSMNWLVSQAIGGVKVVAICPPTIDGVELLETDHSSALDDLPEMSLPPSVFEVCPHCGSTDVEAPTWSRRLKVASCFWMWLILFYPTVTHFEPTKCRSCNRRFHPQSMT